MDVKIAEINRKNAIPFSLWSNFFFTVRQVNFPITINLFRRSRPKTSTLVINLDDSDSIERQSTTIIYIYDGTLLTYLFFSFCFFYFFFFFFLFSFFSSSFRQPFSPFFNRNVSDIQRATADSIII